MSHRDAGRRRAAIALAGATTWLMTAVTVLGASPSPGAGGGDPRSSGQGPGLVGDPLFALVTVITIGLGTVAATLIYVRLTAKRGG